jgi:hypothetical protein
MQERHRTLPLTFRLFLSYIIPFVWLIGLIFATDSLNGFRFAWHYHRLQVFMHPLLA